MHRLIFLVISAIFISIGIAEPGFYLSSLVAILLFSIILLSISEESGAKAKTIVTFTLGFTGLFIFIVHHGIPAGPAPAVLNGFRVIAESIHFNIFIFLFGLYLFVNGISYSGVIGELSWKIVKLSGGKLTIILVSIMILTSLLSGIFDGATVASIMGVITLTILLSSGMKSKDIVMIMLLLVVCTNVGGVWFVLGEPTNILAAEKMGLNPLFFLKYASVFSVIAIILAAIFTYRITSNRARISNKRPEIEILLEGISLKRVHSGQGNLLETMVEMGNIEIRLVKEIETLMDSGIPDFEAALQAGVPKNLVNKALSINLNSKSLSQGLIDYWSYSQNNDPMANIIIGDLLDYVHEEYAKRSKSRIFVISAAFLLIILLGLHAVFTWIPSWISTLAGGIVALLGIQGTAKKNILKQTWGDLSEAVFLIPLFALISMINFLDGFSIAGKIIFHSGNTGLTGIEILASTSLVSAVADNIAVMDVITNIIRSSEHWQYFTLASVVGTALGGFVSPIASVQAIILSTLIRRISKITFIQWIKKVLLFYIILFILYSVVIYLFNYLSIFPATPWHGTTPIPIR